MLNNLPQNSADFMILSEAAKIVARHPDTLKKWIRDRKLVGRKVVGRWMVSRESLATLMAGDADPIAETDPHTNGSHE
jgi:hypothetical protein